VYFLKTSVRRALIEAEEGKLVKTKIGNIRT